MRNTIFSNFFKRKATEKIEVLTIATFEVWKTIKIGKFKNHKGLYRALRRNDIKIGESAINMRQVIKFSKHENEINLVKVIISDLGFIVSTSYEEICNKCFELGLKLCPSEVGPYIRLEYLDQPNREYLPIAMKPLIHSGGIESYFALENIDGVLYFEGNRFNPKTKFLPSDYLLFCI